MESVIFVDVLLQSLQALHHFGNLNKKEGNGSILLPAAG